MYWRFLVWNLRHRRGRKVLNAATMTITIAIVMLFVSVMGELIRVSKGSADRELARILVQPRMGSSDLPVSMTSFFEKIDGVKRVLRQNAVNGQIGEDTFHVLGEEPGALELNSDFFPVAPEAIEAMKTEKTGAIVSTTLAKLLNAKIGQTIELPTQQGPLQLEVVGFSSGNFGYRVSAHYEYIDEFLGKQGGVSFRIFALQKDADRVTKEIIDRSETTESPLTAFSDSQFVSESLRNVAVVPAILGFLGAFLLLTTTLTLANSYSITIRERRIESATMRVLGFHRQKILVLMLGESALMGIVGAIAALVVIWLVFPSGVHLTVGTEKLLQAVKLTPFAIGVGFATATAIPLLGAMPAAIASLRMPLVEALRDGA